MKSSARLLLLAEQQPLVATTPAALASRLPAPGPPPPANVAAEPGRGPFTVCDGVREMMVTKLREWNNYRRLVFAVLVTFGIALVATVVLLFIDSARAGAIGTGLSTLAGGAALLLLVKERDKAGRQADDYWDEYDKYGCATA